MSRLPRSSAAVALVFGTIALGTLAAPAAAQDPQTTQSQAAEPAAPAAPRTPPPYNPDHAAVPVAQAIRIGADITVDGRLDEPVWMTAPPVIDFWQAEPDEGTYVSEPTEVRFLYDD